MQKLCIYNSAVSYTAYIIHSAFDKLRRLKCADVADGVAKVYCFNYEIACCCLWYVESNVAVYDCRLHIVQGVKLHSCSTQSDCFGNGVGWSIECAA